MKLSRGLRVGSLEKCLERYEGDMEQIRNMFRDTVTRIQLWEEKFSDTPKPSGVDRYVKIAATQDCRRLLLPLVR